MIHWNPEAIKLLLFQRKVKPNATKLVTSFAQYQFIDKWLNSDEVLEVFKTYNGWLSLFT